jgi:hypothetical protein
MTCEQARDLAASYVLEALEAGEEAAVRDHLLTCDQPHPEFAELGGVVPALAESVDLVEPPASLRGRIMAAAAADLEARRAAGELPPAGELPAAPDAARSVERPQTMPRTSDGQGRVVSLAEERTRRRSRLAWIAAIAAVLAIVALGAWNVTLRNDLDAATAYRQHVEQVLGAASQPGSHSAILASDVSPSVSGLAVVGADGSVSIVMRGLSPTTGTNVYEAWVIAGDGVPVPIGSFAVAADGTGFLVARGAPSAAGVTVALTLEDGPGATAPKLPIISAGKASS